MSANSSSTSSYLLSHQCPVIDLAVSLARAVLVLPLSTRVLHLGLRGLQRPLLSGSHPELFTYHLSVNELVWVLGVVCRLAGFCARSAPASLVGHTMVHVTYFGEMLFLALMCVEWYAAVVHPVTYLWLKSRAGFGVRSAGVGCVWLLCLAAMSVSLTAAPVASVSMMFCCLSVAIAVTTFCSLSVLRALTRADGGVARSKRQAFRVVSAISGVLWLWFLGELVASSLEQSPLLDAGAACVLIACVGFFYLPTSLVSPILYLHRAGKLSWSCSS